MATTPRKIIVDDNDSSIVYSSSWFLDQSGSTDDLGNFGPTLRKTLHSTSSKGSFQYTFEGTEITVYGTVNTVTGNNRTDPVWSCSIDNQPIENPPPFNFIENNWVMCSATNLTNGRHTLSVNAHGRNQQPFLFDYLRYTPVNQDSALQNALVQVARNDPAISYEGTWVPLKDIATMATTSGTSLTLSFIGRGVTWYGIFPSELPIFESFANYSIDNGPPQNFTLKGLQAGEVTEYNVILLDVDNLVYGHHTLRVSFLSDNTSTPLALLNFLVQNDTTPVITDNANPTSPAIASATSTPAEASDISKNRVNIAGIVCGILAIVLLAILLGFIYLRYRRRKNSTVSPSPWNARRKSIAANFSRPFSRKKIPQMRQVSTLDLLEQEPEERQTPLPAPRSPPIQPAPVTLLPVTQEALLSRSRDANPVRNFQNVENWIQQQASGSRPRADKQKARQTSPPPVSPRQHRIDKQKARQTSPPPSAPSLIVPADQLNEGTSYYGGFQTWGQVKALEAQASAKQRDSYM